MISGPDIEREAFGDVCCMFSRQHASLLQEPLRANPTLHQLRLGRLTCLAKASFLTETLPGINRSAACVWGQQGLEVGICNWAGFSSWKFINLLQVMVNVYLRDDTFDIAA